MKTPSQLSQWAHQSNVKNVGEVTKQRHAEEVAAFTEQFIDLIHQAKIYGRIGFAEMAEASCVNILQNGTDNQKLFEIAFERIDEAIWLVGRFKAAEKKKAADAEALIAYDKMHGGLLAPILSKFRSLLS